jgi:hypothetical protein
VGFRKLLPLALFFGIVGLTKAHAGVFLEPSLGVEWGSSNQLFLFANDPQNKSENIFDNKYYGITAGAKLGYLYETLYVAPQFEMGNTTDLSLVVGILFKGMAEAWMGYIFQSKDNISKGTGMKVGAGIALSQYVQLNAEYVDRNFNEYTGTPKGSGSFTYDGRSKSYKVFLSCPIVF